MDTETTGWRVWGEENIRTVPKYHPLDYLWIKKGKGDFYDGELWQTLP